MPVPPQIDLHYSEDAPPIQCGSIEELDRALDQLNREHQDLAVAISVYGHEVDIGLGSDPTFVCVQIDPRDGEYYLACGEDRPGEHKAFHGAGQDSYWLPKNLVPAAMARVAARHFVEHQELSPDCRWEDWDGLAVTQRRT